MKALFWMKMKMCATVLCAVTVVTGGAVVTVKNATAAPKSGPVYYVDINNKAANDSNSGRQKTRPWKTLQKAFTTLKAGDTCYVMPGTYYFNINVTPAHAGTKGNPIRLIAKSTAAKLIASNDPKFRDDENQVFIKPQTGAEKVRIKLSKDYWKIEGFYFWRFRLLRGSQDRVVGHHNGKRSPS